MIEGKNIFDVVFKIHLAQKCTQYSAEHVQNIRKQTDGVFTPAISIQIKFKSD